MYSVICAMFTGMVCDFVCDFALVLLLNIHEDESYYNRCCLRLIAGYFHEFSK